MLRKLKLNPLIKERSPFRMIRIFIASLKITLFMLLTFLIIPIQALGGIILRKTSLFYSISITYFRLACWIFGIKALIKGTPAQGHVVFVGNHMSYLDIPVIGGYLNATFISKADVRDWPVFGLLAALAHTVFIERSRNAVMKCIEDIQNRLENGRSLILFPEGTSTQGGSVLPFKSTIFDIFLNEKLKNKLLIQPFTLKLIKTNNKRVETAEDYDFYAWHGDIEFWPHLWALGKTKGAEIELILHPPRPAADYESRKEFAKDCHADVIGALNPPPALAFADKSP